MPFLCIGQPSIRISYKFRCEFVGWKFLHDDVSFDKKNSGKNLRVCNYNISVLFELCEAYIIYINIVLHFSILMCLVFELFTVVCPYNTVRKISTASQ